MQGLRNCMDHNTTLARKIILRNFDMMLMMAITWQLWDHDGLSRIQCTLLHLHTHSRHARYHTARLEIALVDALNQQKMSTPCSSFQNSVMTRNQLPGVASQIDHAQAHKILEETHACGRSSSSSSKATESYEFLICTAKCIGAVPMLPLICAAKQKSDPWAASLVTRKLPMLPLICAARQTWSSTKTRHPTVPCTTSDCHKVCERGFQRNHGVRANSIHGLQMNHTFSNQRMTGKWTMQLKVNAWLASIWCVANAAACGFSLQGGE